MLGLEPPLLVLHLFHLPLPLLLLMLLLLALLLRRPLLRRLPLLLAGRQLASVEAHLPWEHPLVGIRRASHSLEGAAARLAGAAWASPLRLP